MMRAFAAGVRGNVPTVVWGDPGVGKTAKIGAYPAAWGFHTETVVGSIREASDFLGLPIEVDGEVRYSPPAFARRAADADRALINFDELTTSAPSVSKTVEGRQLTGVLLFWDDGEVKEQQRVERVVAMAQRFADRFTTVDQVRRAVVDELSEADRLVTGRRVKLGLAAAWSGQQTIAEHMVTELAAELDGSSGCGNFSHAARE